MSKNKSIHYRNFTGRVLLTFENGRIVKERTLFSDEEVSSLNAFFDLARLAGFIIIPPDSVRG
ncbi:TPA: hypothetical protein RRH03_001512 [Klebsiella pneumoniae]|uniref:hypothetical protein n=1 Tax=Klebsiella michiganensis TaxID=1134687 RepID=UPI001FFD73FC|nr:hypothetical protein [Klebsiella michiganensis]MCK2101471.1 hypothetical protein [Klebsiella michiganensis]HDY8465462.1 hypothetical protein [Klebsiella pneumoniae]